VVVPEHTIDELMVVTLARAFDDKVRAFNGAVSFIPVSAFQLARATHAPGLVWVASSLAVDAHPGAIPESTLLSELWGGASHIFTSPTDFWPYAMSGRLNTFCMRGAQIDRFGNINNSVIGADYHHPKVRLPGGGGMPDLTCLCSNIFLWSTVHNPRVFVPKLDFRSGLGYGEGGDHRQRLGLHGGPQLVITNLCVMDFEPTSKSMRLRSLHPGVSSEQVQQATGFEVLLPEGEIPKTAPPREDELKLLRELIDPTGMRRWEFRHN
jgi:glutaconate CoA-transferase subunit B